MHPAMAKFDNKKSKKTNNDQVRSCFRYNHPHNTKIQSVFCNCCLEQVSEGDEAGNDDTSDEDSSDDERVWTQEMRRDFRFGI